MTETFLRNLCRIQKRTISSDVCKQAKSTLIDYFAVTLAGSKASHDNHLTCLTAVNESGDSVIMGLDIRSNMQTAALLNGMSAHVLELDDGHRRGAIHVGATIYSALLAVAEHENLSSEDFFYGAIIGYEATIRLACAIQPGNKLRGYHATGTCGTVGAALGIAAAMGQDFEQMKSTLSAAVTSAAGVLEMQEDGSDLKPYNVGRAAMDAVAAAYIGKARFKAPNDALGGKRGFLKVMTDEPHTEYLTDFDRNAPLAITQIYQKIYASCRHTHPAIEAALFLRKEHPEIANPNNMKSVRVETYKLAVAGHDHTDILGISSAKMSMPFSVALALSVDSAGMGDFSAENVSSENILSLTRKVSVVENKELSNLVPDKRASILYIELTDGSVLSHRVDYPKGEPENPLTDEEVKDKFFTLATASGYTKERCNQIIQMIEKPDCQISDLMKLLH